MFDVDSETAPADSTDLGVPFGARLRDRAYTDPDDIGLIVVGADGTDEKFSLETLDGRANQWGRALAARGATAGTLIGIAIPNSSALVLSVLACWKVGAVPVPMRWDLPGWERGRVLDILNATVVVDQDNQGSLSDEADAQSDAALPEVVSPRLNGICSSGSTGLPKIILNTAPAVWTPAHSEHFMTHWASVARPQTILVPGPMYHTNGFLPLMYLLGGDTLVVLEKFDAATVLDVIERHRITTFTATPTMLARMAAVPGVENRDLSSLDWILQGAAAMPAELLRRWFDLLSPEQIVMAYGMTENLGLTALRGDEWLLHPGSVGRGFRDTEIRILGPDKAPLPPGECGEIFMRAPMSASYEYLGGAKPLALTADGFGSGGDLGHLDADGYLYIADRRTDMIVTGGANVFPAEVENALIGHDGIADVVVLGLPDPQWGRRVHAVVQTANSAALDEQQVIEYAKRRLTSYKVPKTVEFVDEIPRTAATKVSRSEMTRARGG